MVMCSKKYLYNSKSLSIKKQYENDNNNIYNNNIMDCPGPALAVAPGGGAVGACVVTVTTVQAMS